MKLNKWFTVGCATVLTAAMLQPALAHDRRSNDGYGYSYDNSYGGSRMGMPGHNGHYGNDQRGPHGYGHPGMNHHGMGMKGLGNRLDLSDEQEKAIHKIMRSSRKDFRRLEESIRDKRYDLYDQIDAGADSKKLDALADDLGALMAERIKLRVQMRMNIMQELTADQREEARDIPFFGR